MLKSMVEGRRGQRVATVCGRRRAGYRQRGCPTVGSGKGGDPLPGACPPFARHQMQSRRAIWFYVPPDLVLQHPSSPAACCTPLALAYAPPPVLWRRRSSAQQQLRLRSICDFYFPPIRAGRGGDGTPSLPRTNSALHSIRPGSLPPGAPNVGTCEAPADPAHSFRLPSVLLVEIEMCF